MRAFWRSERVREVRVGPLELGESLLEVGEGQGGWSGPLEIGDG